MVLIIVVVMHGMANSVKNLNSEKNRESRIKLIKSILGFDFGDNYLEIENTTRFHPDTPTKVILEFSESEFNEIINFIKDRSTEKKYEWRNDKVTLKNHDADYSKGNNFIEHIDLIFATKRLEYRNTGC